MSDDRQLFLRNERIRVVINALHAKSGGGITYLRNILPLMADDERLELHLFLHASQITLFHPIDERVKVHLFNFRQGFTRVLVWEQFALPLLARVMSADVVFSPANFGAMFAPNHVILLRNALAVAKSEPRPSKRLYWLALMVATFVASLLAKRVIAVSQYALDTLSMGNRKKMCVVHHGVDERFRPTADAPPAEREAFLLAVADIYVQKNLDNLVRALAKVRTKHPDVKLKIAGAVIDTWYHERVFTLIQDLQLNDAVEFLYRQPPSALIDLYRRCRAFVFPSTAETFGMPLVESMASGAPIASSNCTAMPEVVQDAALLFDPSDPDAIAEALTRLIDDAELRDSLSRRALERSRHFSWQRTATATADVLVEASGRAAP